MFKIILDFSFLQVFPDQNKCIRDCIQDLGDIANDIEKCQESSNIAKVTGSSVRMVGGLLAVGGAIAAPFTLGASLALTAVGTGLGIAGNATNFTAGGGRESRGELKARLKSTLTVFVKVTSHTFFPSASIIVFPAS
uniref:Uncharacterized protein n=1 Tax=Callorhinchus milii TaxID=7868 RepID=A0A4W3J317_CALMI